MKTPFRTITVFFVLAVTSVSSIIATESVTPKPIAPVVIFIVRHAEKSSESGDVPLSAEGQARAGTLATMLEPAGISAVFSSQLTFAKETAAPLAARMKLQPTVIPVRETDKLAAALDKLPSGSVALVVSHSGAIAELVEKLGGAKPRPVATNEFDRLFVVSRQPGGMATVAELHYGSGR